MRRIPLVLAVAAVMAACGGSDSGGDGITPPPPPPPPAPVVTTVELSPATATLLAPATQQFTAVAKDASGAVMSRTFTWTSSATSVATVSSSGLVTAVANGVATITAAVDGKQGVAAVTVVASPDGPMVAKADIGPTGGTVGNSEYAVTIPSGALAATATITLVRDTVHLPSITDGAVTPNYTIEGLPADRVVNLRVRIKATAPISGTAALAVTRPTMAFADSLDEVVLGTTLVAAADSAGYLVATVPLRGRPTTWGAAAITLPGSGFAQTRVQANAADVRPQDLKAAAELSGLMKLTRVASAKGNFEVWGFGEDPALTAKATKVARLLEEGRDKILAMGYPWEHRTTWPMQAYLVKARYNGAYYSILPDPFDPNLGYVAYNVDRVDLGWFPGTVIHELFHFTQTTFIRHMMWPAIFPTLWLNEVTSTWMAEKHPSVALPFNHPTSLSWGDSLWSGLANDLVANSGYGKAPLGKWLAETYGEAKIKQMYLDVQNGANPISALLMAFPGPRETWYPQFLKAQLEGKIYPYWPFSKLYPSKVTYADSARTGTQGWLTEPLLGLASQGSLIKRDPARYGPDYSLPVFLDTIAAKAGTLTAFRHALNAPTWSYVGTGDTVRFTPAMVRSTDDLLVLITNTDAKAPYNTTWRLKYLIDQALPEGDILLPDVTAMNNGIRFACDRPGDSVTFSPLDNAKGVWTGLSEYGTWKKTQENSVAPPFATYTWSAYPAYRDTLAAFGYTLASTMEVLRADTIHLEAQIKWALGGPSLRSGGAGGILRHVPLDPGGGVPIPWWSLAVVVAATPFVLRKKGARRLRPILASGVLLLLVGCGIGLISITIDESFDYTFVKPGFVSNLPNAKTPLVDLRNGTGKLTMNNYRVEHWVYFTTAGKPDSVKSTCTGRGTATYTVGGSIYADSVRPPAAALMTQDAQIARLGRALGLDLTRAAPALKARMR